MLLLASLILNFDIRLHSIGGEVLDKDLPELSEISTVSNVTLTFEKEMSLRFTPL